MKQVVVLGMHRSGTSMMGGILERLGVHMGEKLQGEAYHNPLGHYEDLDFTSVNIEVLVGAGGEWNDPPPQDAILKQDVSSKIEGLIARRKDLKIWGWKDPRTSLTMDLFIDHLDNPYVIFCHRRPGAVAASLKKRDGMPEGKARNLRKKYEERVEDFFTRHPDVPRLDIRYQDVLDDPPGNVERIVNFLGIRPSDDQVRQAVAFVQPRKKIRMLKIWHVFKSVVTKPHVVAQAVWKRYFSR